MKCSPPIKSGRTSFWSSLLVNTRVISKVKILQYNTEPCAPIVKMKPQILCEGVSTQRMISSFSLDDQLWMNVCQHPHSFSFLHSAVCEINRNREKFNKLNGEGWCNYVHTIHHHLTRPTSSRLRMNGWSSLHPRYIQLRLIILVWMYLETIYFSL